MKAAILYICTGKYSLFWPVLKRYDYLFFFNANIDSIAGEKAGFS